jgi:hypothetical protein
MNHPSRSAFFYTGSFSPVYIPPNTTYVSDAVLLGNMNLYCSAEHFQPERCATASQLVGERMGNLTGPKYSGLVAAGGPLVQTPNVNKATVSAALYTVGKTTDLSRKVCATA